MEKKAYTTKEVAKVLHVSIRTIQRWISLGKVKAAKDESGKYLIPAEEVIRLVEPRQEQLLEERIIEVLESKRVAYLREMQISMEDECSHDRTYHILRNLIVKGRVHDKTEWGNRWFFLSDLEWNAVESLAHEKKRLIEVYSEHPRGFEIEGVQYKDYSEYLVEQAMILAGYIVVAKETYYFNGKVYRKNSGPGRPADLDFIAKLPEKNVFIGVQVKNTLDYPRNDDVFQLIEICRELNLRPVLVARKPHPMSFDYIKRQSGYVIEFKQYFLRPPFPVEEFNKIRELISSIFTVYRYPPKYLIELFIRMAERL